MERLVKYCPEVLDGYLTLLKGANMDPPGGFIPTKYKELIPVAIETTQIIPCTGHAKRAIQAGATLQELTEVICMCIQLGGYPTYVHSSHAALEAVEGLAKELTEEKSSGGDA